MNDTSATFQRNIPKKMDIVTENFQRKCQKAIGRHVYYDIRVKIINIADFQAYEVDELDVDEYRRPAYEYWVISEWPAHRLERLGDLVLRDFLGMSAVWGRTTARQGISIDDVVGDLMIKTDNALNSV